MNVAMRQSRGEKEEHIWERQKWFMHFERFSRWIWPQKSMKFISIVQHRWKFMAQSEGTILIYVFLHIQQSICRVVCVPHNSFAWLFHRRIKWVNVKESFFFCRSLCINMWLSIWTPLPVVIKTMTFKRWWAKVLYTWFVCW